ncbi:MAG: methyltransferase domain-containing protein [Thermodesulfobacteriota bacterium]
MQKRVQDILSCLKCKNRLVYISDSFVCKKCGIKIQSHKGIPDFKDSELYEGESDILKDVGKRFEEEDFETFLKYCDSLDMKNILPWEKRRKLRYESKNNIEKNRWIKEYRENSIISPGQEQFRITRELIKKAQVDNKTENVLEVGCGRGPWAIIAAESYSHIIAIDMDMLSLLIAKKYCCEKMIKNISFVCCKADNMPFPDNYFDLISSESTLEHVKDQLETIFEIKRVLKNNRVFICGVPNKLNIFTPEPHVNLRFIGFIPKRVAHYLSLYLKDLPYQDINILSYTKLKKLFSKVFSDYYKTFTSLDMSSRGIFRFLKKIPFITSIFNYLGPFNFVVAIKKE